TTCFQEIPPLHPRQRQRYPGEENHCQGFRSGLTVGWCIPAAGRPAVASQDKLIRRLAETHERISLITNNDRIQHEDFHRIYLIDFEDVFTR
ncbi:MAG: hypothetical protein RI573_01655, partial [Balneolaceae bacterium]|nr:hypothetical protein [Balneolaceae bacterium]